MAAQHYGARPVNTLRARYLAARRAPWWLRSSRVVVERRWFEPAGDPVEARFMDSGAPR